MGGVVCVGWRCVCVCVCERERERERERETSKRLLECTHVNIGKKSVMRRR